MSYLIYSDYKRQIQSDNLQQIISSDLTVLSAAERAAMAEVESYLRQKYDIAKEFDSTEKWSNLIAYRAGDRVYLDAPAYVPATAYVIGNLVLQSGNVYRCLSSTTGTFDPTKWILIGAQYEIFSAALPYNEFDFNFYYNVNDNVFWKNKTYKCLIQTQVLSHSTLIQYKNIQSIPAKNIAPDEPVEGPKYWGDATVYAIAAGTLPTDATKWVQLDNRDQQLTMYLIDIVLYHVHCRIAPRNIPDLRIKRYDDAVDWLKKCATGGVTPNIPLLKPNRGNRIAFGGNIKLGNSY